MCDAYPINAPTPQHPGRHSRGSGNPGNTNSRKWIPTSAGMTKMSYRMRFKFSPPRKTIMIKLQHIALLAAVFSAPVLADESQSSVESIKQLLAVMELRKQVDTTMAQVDQMARASMNEILRNHPMTPEQQKVLDDTQGKTCAIIKEELNWDTMEPVYVKIYRESFTQQEVDGLIAFYQSSAGRALINKMPVVAQNTMVEMQKRMGPVVQKLQEVQRDMAN